MPKRCETVKNGKPCDYLAQDGTCLMNESTRKYSCPAQETVGHEEKDAWMDGMSQKKIDESIHAHLAYFGSELACQICNPVCWQNHQFNNLNYLKPCENVDCPLGDKKMAEINEKLKHEMEKVEDEELLEEFEDEIRRSKNKSIRRGGKYGHSRGKEKRREA
jgi:hypothetical protein